MEQNFTQKMKDALLALKAEIYNSISSGNDEFKQIMEGSEPKDSVDAASDDIDRKMIEALGSQDVKRLKLIDSALLRIEQGKYGLCLKCGKKIPQSRLQAIPYALMCVDCKNAEEKRNR
ncbi:MAG: TraR/DksA family transcriptional regulator [Spirochaetaceae bacterium]|jgi:RNA polymerase-binding protein DksA|nr:TraR/DksA family transcriptional regulator [Spirochaetaceae bacterium]